MPVKVTENTLKALEELRKSGTARLTDLPASVKRLDEMGRHEASDWVQNNTDDYWRGLREGFIVG